MDNSDVTIEILKDIREEMRATREELGEEMRATREELRDEIRETNHRVGLLEQRVVESEIRTSSALLEVNGTMREVRDLLRDRFDLRDRVERCEREIEELKRAGRS